MLKKLSDSLRMLVIDTVENANSGHLGMPLGMADVATVLFHDFLRFNSEDPTFPLRDRFVLSSGHGSSLLYSLLYLTGYDYAIADLKLFRKIHSKTPGHPEFNQSLGVECTTGPLGQGIAMAVGIAIEERKLNAIFGDDVDYKTYVFAGDGDFMEGISHEALSLAGHLQLKNLIIFFDNNKITIDGSTDLTCSDDHIKKFESYGFFVQEIDGHNFEEIHDAISNAQKSEIPSIIMCNTKIGKGIDSFEGTCTIHGKIPPHDVLNAVREKNFWTPFSVPNDVLNEWRSFSKRSQKYYLASKKISAEIEKLKSEPFFDDVGFEKLKTIAVHDARDISTKQSLNEILNNLAMKKFISGSADLSGSNGTKTKSMLQINAENFAGNYIHYGIREHAMGAIVNGISLNKIFKACAATFLSFSDYMREPIRLSALMNVNSIFVFSHDSIFIGEDGPTHQPIEQLDSLRIIPNFYVWRPADFLETAFAFQEILSANHPSALILTRQEVPNLHYKKFLNDEIGKGGYVFDDFEFLKNVSRETIQNSNNYIKKILLIATGSELALAVKIKDILKNHKIDSRIISIPCFERFFENDDGYVQKVFCGDEIDSRIFIEASTGICFDRYIKRDARDFSITIDRFGASGSKKDLENYFGFNEKIAEKILNRIS